MEYQYLNVSEHSINNPELKIYRNIHVNVCYAKDINAYMFASDSKKARGRLPRKTCFDDMLRRAVRKAKIEKKISLYTLRDTAITNDAEAGASNNDMELRYGWQFGSDMSKKYIKRAASSANRAYLRRKGVLKDEDPIKANTIKSIECPRCKTKNEKGAERCYNCGMLWDAKKSLYMEKLNRSFEKHLKDEVELLKDKVAKLEQT